MSEIISKLLQNTPKLRVNCINSQLSIVENDIMGIVSVSFGAKWKKKEYKLTNQQQIEVIFQEPDSKSITFLLWTPQSEQNKFTVFINNFADGWITLLNKYSAKFNKEIGIAAFSNEKNDFPKFKFSYRNGFVERNVQLLKDSDKWQFYAGGDPLPFEDIANYRQKKITKRLNNDIIEGYMSALGFDCTKPEFWLSAGEAIEYRLDFQ